MPFLFLTVFVIAVVAFASPPVALAFGLLAFAIPYTVKVTAQSVAGLEFGFGESAKAVAYSLGLALLFLLALIGAGGGSVTLGPVLIAVLGASYVLGFKLALGTAFVPSIIIAGVSTLISAMLVAAARAAF
jgi:hypothetical protein